METKTENKWLGVPENTIKDVILTMFYDCFGKLSEMDLHTIKEFNNALSELDQPLYEKYKHYENEIGDINYSTLWGAILNTVDIVYNNAIWSNDNEKTFEIAKRFYEILNYIDNE